MEANAETMEMLDLSLQSDFCLERKKSPCSVLEKGLTVKKKRSNIWMHLCLKQCTCFGIVALHTILSPG